MKRQPVAGLLLLLIWSAAPSLVRANSVDGVAFPSTPFMPPHGFEWVPLLFIILFTAANTCLLRKQWGVSTRQGITIAIGVGVGIALLALILIPLHYWWYIRGMHWGGHALLGWNWARISDRFILMNGISLLLVIAGAACLAYYHPKRTVAGFPKVVRVGVGIAMACALMASLYPLMELAVCSLVLYGFLLFLSLTAGVTAVLTLGKQSLALFGINIAIYLLCLAPYLATGAFAHGYGPWQDCRHQLSYGIGPALIAYTRAHNGHLPQGRTMEQVFTELQPYYAETIMGQGGWGPIEQPLICKTGEWYDRHPRAYTWNADLAGQSIANLKTLPQPALLITCPYHPRHFINTEELADAFDNPNEGVIPVWKH